MQEEKQRKEKTMFPSKLIKENIGRGLSSFITFGIMMKIVNVSFWYIFVHMK